NLKYLMIMLYVTFFTTQVHAQDPQWDDTKQSGWKKEFKQVGILSRVDSASQKAYLYATTSKTPKPLIVSLHTWSGNYSQKDPVAEEILARNWNYIHPDFRGKNNHPQAMGSPLVVADIEDAIHYALQHTNADPDEVHIVGVSGGGYDTLLIELYINYHVISISVRVPMSALYSWYTHLDA